jgi:hypothetical protein
MSRHVGRFDMDSFVQEWQRYRMPQPTDEYDCACDTEQPSPKDQLQLARKTSATMWSNGYWCSCIGEYGDPQLQWKVGTRFEARKRRCGRHDVGGRLLSKVVQNDFKAAWVYNIPDKA